LTAIISLNLAYLNLLPIPALDGGHVMFLIIEKIQGKPVDEKFAEIISSIFFYLLIIFMLYIVYNDIIALITNKI
jgi:regulator of sigma E protease